MTDCYLPRLGGIELQVHDLAAGQVALGHSVVVYTTTEGPPGAAGEDRGSGVEVVRVPGLSERGEKIRYRRTRAGVAAFMDGLDSFDAVHVHASSFSPLGFLAAHHASRRGVPTVATVHSLWAKATPLFRGADMLAGWADWPVVWSAVSNAAARSLRSILAGREEVHIVPNGVHQEEWQVGHTGARIGELRVTVVSRLARRKRTLPLVQMLSAVRAEMPPGAALSVEILGEGPQRPDIERYIRAHGMEAWVRLRGRRTRSEIREVLARTDLFVAPASLESFGIAALEARCAGVPVLARSGTGVQDFVTHGQEGWLVGSDRAMVDTIVSLTRAPELLKRVADHNRLVPAAISWPQVLAGCEELYQEAARRHGRPWIAPERPAVAPRLAAPSPGPVPVPALVPDQVQVPVQVRATMPVPVSALAGRPSPGLPLRPVAARPVRVRAGRVAGLLHLLARDVR